MAAKPNTLDSLRRQLATVEAKAEILRVKIDAEKHGIRRRNGGVRAPAVPVVSEWRSMHVRDEKDASQ